jgi:hypothetical protein
MSRVVDSAMAGLRKRRFYRGSPPANLKIKVAGRQYAGFPLKVPPFGIPSCGIPKGGTCGNDKIESL